MAYADMASCQRLTKTALTLCRLVLYLTTTTRPAAKVRSAAACCMNSRCSLSLTACSSRGAPLQAAMRLPHTRDRNITHKLGRMSFDEILDLRPIYGNGNEKRESFLSKTLISINSDELKTFPCSCAPSTCRKHVTPSTVSCCGCCSHASACQRRC